MANNATWKANPSLIIALEYDTLDCTLVTNTEAWLSVEDADAPVVDIKIEVKVIRVNLNVREVDIEANIINDNEEVLKY
jgi:hypothetical protein